MTKQQILQPVRSIETLDREKLNAILIKNWPWILLIVLSSNLAAYLTLRWTKDTYKSDSEIKLDIKSNASELGIKTFIEDQNLNQLSGEIEQIRSPLFLGQVIDSLDLWVSYFSVGKILDDEMYRRSPFIVEYHYSSSFPLQNIPIYFRFSKDGFTINVNNNGKNIVGQFDKPFVVNGIELTIRINPEGTQNKENNYYFIINSRESLLNFISRNLTVEPINFNANTIRISFQDFNAVKTQTVVNAIDSLYLQFSNFQKNQASIQKILWLNRELGVLEEKLGDYESYFKDFTIQNKSSDLKEDLKVVIKEINRLDSLQYFMNRRIVELNNLIEGFSKNDLKNFNLNTTLLPEYITKKLETLNNKLKEKDRLSLAYNETTFAYRQFDKEISTLESQIFEDLEKLKSSILTRSVEVENQRRQLEKNFASMPDKNTQFAKNQRYYKLYEEFYLSLMQSKAEFELAQAGSTPDFKILASASIPKKPIAPKRSLIYAVGVVSGLTMAFFFVGLLYLLNDKITSVREIESNLSVPVLGMLPMNAVATKTPFFILDHPKSRLSEAIRNLRSNLDFLNPTQQMKIVAVSSTISGEGKSFLAQNLSGAIALSKKKVILIDLDMRKHTKTLPFPLPDSNRGVSTILIKKDTWRDCIVPTNIPYLDYLPNGPIPPNPAELLLTGEFDKLLDDLKANYDYLVIDTPPAGLVTDGVIALKKSDISIYMFRCNYSRKENLKTLDRMIQINKINNIAVVFNDFIPPTDNGYGYYEESRPSKRFMKFFKS
jgi:capsular exopolysaccharide synthesis family protein